MAHSCLAWLNEAGILFATVGGVLIFIWGPPQPSFEPGTVLYTALRPNAEQNKHRHKRMSKIGLGIILAGFAMQAAANFPPWAAA